MRQVCEVPIPRDGNGRQELLPCLTVLDGGRQAASDAMKHLSPASRWLLLAGFAVAGMAVVGAAWWWTMRQGYDVRGLIGQLLAWMREMGPWVFFGLMTVLPAVGAPISVFTLMAGPVFVPTLGLPLVLLLSFISLGLNLLFTYALARWLFRPWIEWFCGWLGFKIPDIDEADQRSLVILVRITPGPPYILQNYLLGVARISFPSYFLISWVLVSLNASAFIVFGDALAQGKGRGALLAVSLLVAFAVGVRFARKRFNRAKIKTASVITE